MHEWACALCNSLYAEAEYAWNYKPIVFVRVEKYKPISWLGIILGKKLYIDCLRVEEVENCAVKVARDLGERGKRIGREVGKVTPVQQQNTSPATTVAEQGKGACKT